MSMTDRRFITLLRVAGYHGPVNAVFTAMGAFPDFVLERQRLSMTSCSPTVPSCTSRFIDHLAICIDANHFVEQMRNLQTRRTRSASNFEEPTGAVQTESIREKRGPDLADDTRSCA